MVSTQAPVSVLVLGPHRSGTSAATRFLNLLGVPLGKDLLPSAEDNLLGFWENRRVFEIHERLLSALGSSWHDYRPLPPGWWKLDVARGFRDEIAETLRDQFGGQPLWGVKDPRLCRLLPLWLELLPELGIEMRFVIVARNPLEVAHSLEQRNRFSHEKSLLLYIDHMISALLSTENEKRVIISYPRLLQSWPAEAMKISEILPISVPDSASDTGRAIDAFLDPSARHHRCSLSDADRELPIPGWAMDLHRALAELSPDPARVRSLSNHAQSSLANARALYQPELDRVQHESDQLLADSNCQAKHLQGRVVALESELAPAKQRAEKLANEVVGLQQQVAGLRRQISELREEAVASGSKLGDLTAEYDRVAKELEGSRSSARASLRRMQRSEEELQKLQNHLTALLSGRLYRYSRPIRQLWYSLKGEA
jgi:hypothetical protein